jgi:hypothetical protein
MQRTIIVKQVRRAAEPGAERRAGRRHLVVQAGAGCGPEGAADCCPDDICACLCGCEQAEITEEAEDGHTLIKIRVPKATREGGEEDALVRAAGVSDAVENLGGEIGKLVRLARSQGSSWTDIGAALGISKQAAWERFSGED